MSKRIKIFLKRGFQPRFVFLVCGSLLVLLLFAGSHGYYALSAHLPEDLFLEIKPQIVASTIRLFLVGFLYIFVVVVAAMFLAHRAAGPLVRIEEEMKSMAEGQKDVAPLRVREGDDLEGFIASLNKLIGRIKGKEG